MSVVRRLKTLLPLPSFWKGEERSFGLRIQEAYEELQINLESSVYTKGQVSMRFHASGYIVSSNTVHAYIALDKLIPSGAEISVDKYSVIMRGGSGLVNSQSSELNYVGRSGYTVTADTRNNNRLLHITLKRSSNFTNITNGAPVITNGDVIFTIS